MQIARRLQMVSGQYAEAAGKNAQALMDAELHGKIGDLAFLDFIVNLNVAAKFGFNRFQAAQIETVARQLFELALRQTVQEHPGIAFNFPPQRRVDALEKLNGRRMPAPPHIE
ncbi:hypothetical protein SDC9_140065 [bioreactor metagenome]|uniref:Uncharacterized protein n=1 Tax=bioreactor metagenome TaxID=1076179 RepID=A0A645DUG6_9ZZZZ